MSYQFTEEQRAGLRRKYRAIPRAERTDHQQATLAVLEQWDGRTLTLARLKHEVMRRTSWDGRG